MGRKVLIFILTVAALLAFAGCNKTESPSSEETGDEIITEQSSQEETETEAVETTEETTTEISTTKETTTETTTKKEETTTEKVTEITTEETTESTTAETTEETTETTTVTTTRDETHSDEIMFPEEFLGSEKEYENKTVYTIVKLKSVSTDKTFATSAEVYDAIGEPLYIRFSKAEEIKDGDIVELKGTLKDSELIDATVITNKNASSMYKAHQNGTKFEETSETTTTRPWDKKGLRENEELTLFKKDR